MSETAESLGQRLKAERERKGMSAQKAADELHLDAWIVAALETDDYARIGPAVYAKGHLKRYAGLLGVPLDAMPAALGPEFMYPNPPPPAEGTSAAMQMAMTPTGATVPWLSLAAVAVIALIVGGIFWWRPWHPRMPRPAPAAQAPAVTSSPPPAAAPAPEDTANTELPAAAAPAAAAAPSPASAAPSARVTPADPSVGSGHARLRLSFSADCWVDVRDALGQRVYAGNVHANNIRTLAGEAPLRVYLRSTGGVQLEVNKHAVTIAPQFVHGDVSRFEAGADGVLRPDRHAPPTTPRARG